MVSVKLQGGLGNQLFQMATCIAHAMDYGFTYAIPNTAQNKHKRGSGGYKLGSVRYSDDVAGLVPYKEPYFHYAPLPPKDNIMLEGFFQSANYFHRYRDEIIDLFGMEIKQILKGWCSIHVRRGDYISMPDFHPAVGMIYIADAIITMKRKADVENFIFVSDDIKWCEDNFGHMGSCAIFRRRKDEIDDLMTAASCAHQIGSNSSFSWWAHYLNPNPDKVGVFPRLWFGKSLPHNTKDIYLPSMYVI